MLRGRFSLAYMHALVIKTPMHMLHRAFSLPVMQLYLFAYKKRMQQIDMMSLRLFKNLYRLKRGHVECYMLC
jgi:hypothetical protein